MKALSPPTRLQTIFAATWLACVLVVSLMCTAQALTGDSTRRNLAPNPGGITQNAISAQAGRNDALAAERTAQSRPLWENTTVRTLALLSTFLVALFTVGTMAWNHSLQRKVRARTEQLSATVAKLEREVADRQIAERALATSEYQYRTTLDSMPDPTFVVDRNVRITLVNEALHRTAQRFGASIDVTSEQLHNTFPFLSDYTRKEISDVFSTGREIEREHVLSINGHELVAEMHRIPITDDSGAVRYVVNVIHNVTEARRAQDALKESEQKFLDMVENSRSIILRMNPKGVVTFFNRYAEEFFGFTKAEIVGSSVVGTIVPAIDSDGADLAALISDIVQNPSRHESRENENLRKDGQRVWVAWTNRPIYTGNGAISEVLCVGTDMTERRRAARELETHRRDLEELVRQRTSALQSTVEQLTQEVADRRKAEAALAESEKLERIRQQQLIQADKMASLGILVSGVAHEINNPNNFIALNGDNLRDIWRDAVTVLDRYRSEHGPFPLAGLDYSEVRTETGQLIDGISEGSKRIRTIVQSLKDFARAGTGDTNKPLCLNAVIEAATVILGNLIKKSTDRFVTGYAANLPPVKGDFQRVEQVMINLITNACQALTSRTQALSIATFFDAAKRVVGVMVRDEGVGIPPENLKHIMDPFFTTKRDTGGTGLGLSISYGIVKDHHGDLIIDSQIGAGTTVTVTFPLSEVTQGA